MTESEAELKAKAFKLARGSYQRDLVTGKRCWSGADLTSTAKSYGKHYATSRKNLYARLRDNGLAYLIKRKKNKLELRFGQPPAWFRRTQCAAGVCWVELEPGLLEKLAVAAMELP